ncbi:hypothetical protein P3T37_000939 [Kitasatospora sp. MAA4]|uniref:DUF3159 domain-containing protein n=1 Tax=Kitasatospora sp. MAA4 TaxID=3035093 RepID=UPI0024751B03|nr:DUF3159 domain-containing protein [Kitasatospora sp. MAA4]MDH6131565.1 hypothetical protein [Kitasatospora sp. MAA4]
MTNPPGGEHDAAAPLSAALTQVDEPPAAPESPEEAAAREAAASREAADTVIKAFGGVRGMIDMTLPGLVFILTFNITHQVATAAWAALGLSGIFVVLRLLRRETVQHAFGGVFGVAIGAYIAMKTGKAQDFYLPGLLYNVGYCIVLAISALVRWPAIGVTLGPVTGEMFTWRTKNPGRLAAYTKATWAWVVIMGIKPVILFPLYFTGNVNLLGWLKVALGIPPMLLAMYVTWRILLTAPPPIKAEEPAEDPA